MWAIYTCVFPSVHVCVCVCVCVFVHVCVFEITGGPQKLECHGCILRSLATEDHSVVIVTANTGQLPQSWHVPFEGLDVWDT